MRIRIQSVSRVFCLKDFASDILATQAGQKVQTIPGQSCGHITARPRLREGTHSWTYSGDGGLQWAGGQGAVAAGLEGSQDQAVFQVVFHLRSFWKQALDMPNMVMERNLVVQKA